jgi:hypothetical protein
MGPRPMIAAEAVIEKRAAGWTTSCRVTSHGKHYWKSLTRHDSRVEGDGPIPLLSLALLL